MNCRTQSLIGLAVCLAIISASDGSQFIPLGFIGDADNNSSTFAMGLDATGDTVVGMATFNGQQAAFVWRQSTGLQILEAGHGTLTANAVSADRKTVVGRAATPNSANGESFVANEGNGFALIGSFTASPVGSAAEGISADGAIVAGWSSAGATPFEAYRWTSESGLIPLGDLSSGDSYSVANGISADGAVIVGESGSSNGAEAFRWEQSTGMVGIGDLAGGAFRSTAFDASKTGDLVVGVGASTNQPEEAFRWEQSTGMIGLGQLPETYERSIALAVSDDGTAIGGTSGLTADDLTAFIWDANNGMRSLQQILTSEPNLIGDLTGWRLAMINDISGNGKAVAGWGYNPQGRVEGFLVRFDQPLGVPEPGAAGILMLVNIGLSYSLRSRKRHSIGG
jgi:probable HAF family extracellular repeat protein